MGENGNYLTGTGDGYGELGPSWDLQDAFVAAGDSIRSHGCIMLGGDYYAELHKADGGYTVPLAVNVQGVHAALKNMWLAPPGITTATVQNRQRPIILIFSGIQISI